MAYIKNPVQAVSYSKFRPSPPKELIKKIVDFLTEGIKKPLGCALDIGCGSGQSTEILAPYFQRVIGVDNSKEQLQHAENKNKYNNVIYRLGVAEQLEEDKGSVHLVTAGMAVHWFNMDRFYSEVGRVLQPQGVLALYGYSVPEIAVDDISLVDTVKSMFGGTLRQYMPEESRLVYFDGYRSPQFSKFPFSNNPAQRFEFLLTKKNASVEDFIGYFSTTSAFQIYMMKHGEEDAYALLSDFKCQLQTCLGATRSLDNIQLDINFPYVLLLSRKDM